MARELHLHLSVVVPDNTLTAGLLANLTGRELPGAPGSWIATARADRDDPHPTMAPADHAEPAEVDSLEDWSDVTTAEADADAGLSD